MRKIGIIVNPERDPGLFHLHQVLNLLSDAGYQTVVSCCDFKSTESFDFCAPEECFDQSDLVLTLGGDGTLLKAASYALTYDVPLLGINLGHLGFLAEMEEGEIPDLISYISGNLKLSKRMVLNVNILRDHQPIAEMTALNDAVLRSRSGKPADIVLADDNGDLLDYFCDGFIVATPTGSTAYSMSAGGPIMEPTSTNIVATPICPHTLGSRSVVFDGDGRSLYLSVRNADQIEAHLEYDGNDGGQLHNNDIVCIKCHHKPLSLVQLHQKSFYNVLNDKISRRKR